MGTAEEDPTNRPDQTHIHALSDGDLLVEEQLVVQRVGWHRQASNTQPVISSCQLVQVLSSRMAGCSNVWCVDHVSEKAGWESQHRRHCFERLA